MFMASLLLTCKFPTSFLVSDRSRFPDHKRHTSRNMSLKILKMISIALCFASILVFLTGLTEFNIQFSLDNQTLCGTCLSPKNQLCFHPLKPPVEPLLSANHNLSEDDFNWWKHLQNEKRDYNTYKKTVNSLFRTFPTILEPVKLSRDSCKTCAVVGNSGNLKGSRRGPQIDFHDYVIRINRGRTKGFEEDVGTKTTHQVMYPESAVDLDNSTHLVLAPFKILDLEWLRMSMTTGFHGTSYAPVKSKIAANKDLVMVINPAFIRYAHDTWLGKKGRYPSTGFITLALALNICNEVHVYGFGADKDGNWNHYFEALSNQGPGIHPGQQEYDVIQHLDEQKQISFYRGW
ncbi:CMP-N-acetylneuraminate-beta-galactosamide-alpha-2,3-sialyltransferase 1-like isoform X1 [Mugil cephalus]|uniref:CMP-N-acetylneuraminate-beta-galactosamide- alpha-2,3-sialyltransferase 1-like isoform X1 n=2 Tax=Mugil cephalus TaxID=48193 RepID=UPI001FB6A5AB|nr:CMP-N-acetylneuraminate-beta-galactosamide-alpha-2,3-sialyltransferase 1-like isoform X1 [Mugil cephalus]